jgi:hypothetical protein
VQLGGFVLQRFGFLQTVMSPVDRLPQSLSLNRLQEIVNGMKLKRSDGVFIECGHKGNQGQPVFSYGLDHAQTIKLRHLKIKKSQVGPLLFDYLDRLRPVAGLADQLDILEGAKHSGEKRSCRPLIIGNDDSQMIGHARLLSSP